MIFLRKQYVIQLLKTKTFWVGLAAIFTAVGLAVSGEGSWGEVASAAILGLGLITGRHAMAKGR